ncbi:lycopene cyclase family protein [Salinifilum ghardaiensis]
MRSVVDVLVAGAGPAGRSVAAACADTGLEVALVDPNPRRGWPHTYAAWRSELPPCLPEAARAAVMPRVRVHGTGWHTWHSPYVVLDNAALWEHLQRPDVTEITGRVAAAEHGPTGSTVHLRDGRCLAAAAVVDATGPARVLCGGRPPRTPAQQSAVGVVLAAEQLPGGEDADVFMDWRPAPDSDGGWPTFRYAVRTAPGRLLVEETALARRPALPLALLRRRLAGRLAAAGVDPDQRLTEERVRFPVDDPLPRPGRVIPFGAAAGLVHPASGFSVATSLQRAPWLAAAISAGLGSGPQQAARTAWAMLWPPRQLGAHLLRRRALHAMLALPPHLVPEMFEAFLTLPPRHRTAFLTGDGDPARTAAAMSAMFRNAPARVRRRLAWGSVRPGSPIARHGFGRTGPHEL